MPLLRVALTTYHPELTKILLIELRQWLRLVGVCDEVRCGEKLTSVFDSIM